MPGMTSGALPIGELARRTGLALAAVHAFLRFQISDHRTGDDPSVQK